MRILSGTRTCAAVLTCRSIFYYCLCAVRSVYPGGAVHWDGEESVLPAPSVPVRSEVQMHLFGHFSSDLSDG